MFIIIEWCVLLAHGVPTGTALKLFGSNHSTVDLKAATTELLQWIGVRQEDTTLDPLLQCLPNLIELMVSGATRHSDGVLSALKSNGTWDRFLVDLCEFASEDMKPARSFIEHMHAIASLSMNQREEGSTFTPTRKSSKEEACRAFYAFMTSKLPFSLRNPSSLAAGTTVIFFL